MYDFLSMELESAIETLAFEGLKWQVHETRPHNKVEVGFDRVVKQEVIDDTYILTVCKIPDAYR